ncbi:MAG: extracellular solute-binding protein [Leptolyngbya sp. SIO1D8]|nr:extracellular solute-binding protein [Leptolyngbya sp. SIO1D8]
MYRRNLLAGLVALAAAQVACQQTTTQTLRIAALKGVLPPQVLSAFRAALQTPVSLKVNTQINASVLFHQLQQWQTAAEQSQNQPSFNPFSSSRLATLADWVSLNDYWLVSAIQQELISPLVVETIPQWSDLPKPWQRLLKRDGKGFPSRSGAVWATPYRWGNLVIVYANRSFERLGWQPTQWQDLWKAELAGRISLPNHPRLVLGIVLKSLGYSANDAAPESHQDFENALNTLSEQVKVYASDDYIQPLIQGDTWLAVGWSTDIRPIVAQYRQLKAIVPDPGTLLSADLWVKPRSNDTDKDAISLTELDSSWLSHWWKPETLTLVSLFSQGLSPLLITPEALTETDELSPTNLLLPSAAQLQQSDFLEPLPSESIERYTQLWKRLRGSE